MPVPDSLSRIVEREGSAPYAFVAEANRTLTVGEFAADIAACADSLPSCRFAVNACTNRYRFAVAFFAAITRGQINLLPSRRDAATLDALRRDYQDSAILSDKPADEPTDQPHARSDVAVDLTPGGHGTAAIPQVDHAKWRPLCSLPAVRAHRGLMRRHGDCWTTFGPCIGAICNVLSLGTASDGLGRDGSALAYVRPGVGLAAPHRGAGHGVLRRRFLSA